MGLIEKHHPSQLKAKENLLKAKAKELLASRENAMRLEVKVEGLQTTISILYCVIGVLAVLLLFMCGKSMCGASDEDDDDLPGSPRRGHHHGRNKGAENMA